MTEPMTHENISTISILCRDDDLLVVDKPPGLLSQPGKRPEHKDSLITRLNEVWPEARIVHRLDCDTSGVMVLAMNADAHRELSRQFHDRETEKRYIAIVDGIPPRDSGEIDLPLAVDFDNRPRNKVDFDHGRPAQTQWQVLEKYDDSTRLLLTPITGRSHQLRVHLLAIGHVILGDPLYASPAIKARSTRLLLHAWSLSLTHPTNSERLCFTAPLPF